MIVPPSPVFRASILLKLEATGKLDAAPRYVSSGAAVLPLDNSWYRVDGLWPYDIAVMNRHNHLRHSFCLAGSFAFVLASACFYARAAPQTQAPQDEIVADQPGVRVMRDVALDGTL